jgi:glycosyltransferase involved in cell wall biosynthesis
MKFMRKSGRKYIYISNLDFDGTVFKTQVLDWLHLYQENNLVFDLIQAFHIKDLMRYLNTRRQLKEIKSCTILFKGSFYMFPSKSIFYILNGLIIYLKIFKDIFKYREIVIFSRALLGKEIAFIRKISPARIIFYFDARAAAAEENKYMAIKRHDFSLKKYIIIANVYYLQYRTLSAANKVFVVSKVLGKYFQDTFDINKEKFVLYPCLSDSKKFFFNNDLRREGRIKLQINDSAKVFIYSGGISDWHMSDKMISFFNQLLKFEYDSFLIYLTKDKTSLKAMITKFPEVKPRIFSFAVPNEEVNMYLNAADYGLLFRENTIMNNVASPTKFAEYMLCGLPVIISEGVGDFSTYLSRHDLGILIKESAMNDPEKFDFNNFLKKSFDRAYIADVGRKNFAKDSIINNIIEEFKL